MWWHLFTGGGGWDGPEERAKHGGHHRCPPNRHIEPAWYCWWLERGGGGILINSFLWSLFIDTVFSFHPLLRQFHLLSRARAIYEDDYHNTIVFPQTGLQCGANAEMWVTWQLIIYGIFFPLWLSSLPPKTNLLGNPLWLTHKPPSSALSNLTVHLSAQSTVSRKRFPGGLSLLSLLSISAPFALSAWALIILFSTLVFSQQGRFYLFGCDASEATRLDFVCFVVYHPCLFLASTVYFGLFCFINFLFFWGCGAAESTCLALFVLLLSTLVYCQPTELIWVFFFINFQFYPPPPSNKKAPFRSAHTAQWRSMCQKHLKCPSAALGMRDNYRLSRLCKCANVASFTYFKIRLPDSFYLLPTPLPTVVANAVTNGCCQHFDRCQRLVSGGTRWQQWAFMVNRWQTPVANVSSSKSLSRGYFLKFSNLQTFKPSTVFCKWMKFSDSTMIQTDLNIEPLDFG